MEDNKNVLTPETEEVSNTKAEPEKQKASIDIQPIKFDADAVTMYLNGMQLREKIDSMFKAVFADYIGCKLNMNVGQVPDVVARTLPASAIYVDLVFSENTKDGYHVLKRRSETKGSSMLSRANFVMGGLSSRTYAFDEDAMESLEEFIPRFNSNKKIDWYQRSNEVVNGAPMGFLGYGYNGGTTTEVNVLGFPVEPLLKKIYGAQDDEGHDMEYGCHMIRSTIDGRDLVLQVTQLKTATVSKLYSVMGMAQSTFGNPFLANYR